MAQFTIRVPSELGDKGLVPFFRGWRWHANPGDEVVIDISACEFMAPWSLTLFTAYALWLGDARGADVRIRVDPGKPAGRNAIQAGLFELLNTPRPAGTLGTNEFTITPLTQIRTSQDIPRFVTGVAKLLDLTNEEVQGAVSYALTELLRNVVQHSKSPVGGLAMAQFFPRTGLVEIVVADRGIGVLGALRPRYPELNSDLAALKFALLPHVSGTFGMGEYGSMQNNAGLGLFFIREIATRAGGGFFLGSGKALVDLRGKADGTAGKMYVESETSGWHGTFAMLQLRKDAIEDFAGLLAVCRGLAAEARRDDAQVALDFVEEIPESEDIEVIRVHDFNEDVDEAARIRDDVITPRLMSKRLVVLDFEGIRFATQSFVHALMYRLIRDIPEARAYLTLARATNASKEAVRAVAAYARTAGKTPVVREDRSE